MLNTIRVNVNYSDFYSLATPYYALFYKYMYIFFLKFEKYLKNEYYVLPIYFFFIVAVLSCSIYRGVTYKIKSIQSVVFLQFFYMSEILKKKKKKMVRLILMKRRMKSTNKRKQNSISYDWKWTRYADCGFSRIIMFIKVQKKKKEKKLTIINNC